MGEHVVVLRETKDTITVSILSVDQGETEDNPQGGDHGGSDGDHFNKQGGGSAVQVVCSEVGRQG